jgi:hypothetical protein
MSIQEIEELEFAPRTEQQNCFAEAEQHVAYLATHAVEYGDGPIRVKVSAPYYCKATDAYVGQYPIFIHHVHTVAEAEALRATYESYEDEIQVEWVDPDARAKWEARQAADAARQAAEADPTSDQYCPF